MSEVEKNVAAGVSTTAATIGLTGLVPLKVLTQAQVRLRRAPGTLRIRLELPAGDELRPGTAVQVRIYGGDAGLDFDRGGQIVRLNDVKIPIEIAYRPRVFPSPPPQGQLSLDLSFWHRKGTGWGIQDVQWRQPVAWDKAGGTAVELRFAPES